MTMLKPGSLILQRYQIVRLIGRGGMGAVYEAVDRRLRNTVALKQMIGDDTESAAAFEQEAQLLAVLRHPALPKVIDYFRDGADRYLVMEFFAGPDLSALLARHGGPFPVAEALSWADQLLDALHYLHTREPPVLHRDIKPQNLKLTPEGQVVLLDFGLAKGIGPEAGPSIFGYTLQYAPLEQIQGSGTDPRSDLYALGATFYHLLTDRAPISAPIRAEAHLEGRADPLLPAHLVNPAIPVEVSNVLAQAMALRREDRPPSAAAMRQALRLAAPALAATVAVAYTPSLAAGAWGAPAAGPSRPISIGWEQVRAAAQAQLTPTLRELSGTSGRLGPYVPTLYVARAEAEAHLQAFLAGDSNALLLIGDSGVGKTCLLAHWAATLQSAGHAALFYRCGGSLSAELDREISRDLGRETPEALVHDLVQIGRLAAEAGRRLVLIFDGLNEYRSGPQGGPQSLLKQLDSLAGRIVGSAIRIVISCNSATWGQLERAGATNLFWSAYYATTDGEPWVRLALFTPAELALAYEQYRRFFHLQTPLESLPPLLRERLRKPLMLRMVAESCRDRPVDLATRRFSLGLFRRYYEERVRQRREFLFMDELAGEMLRRGVLIVPIRELVRNPHLRDELLREDPDSAYCRLLDSGVLVEHYSDQFTGEAVGFAYTELGAYVLARHVLSGAAGSAGLVGAVTDLMARARTFPLAFDVARIALLVARQPAAFEALACSPDIELRELAAQSLVELFADDPHAGANALKALCERDSDETRRTALKAAYYIGPPAREVFLWAAARGSPALRRVARDTLYLIWRSDPDFTYGLLRDLVTRIGPSTLRNLRQLLEFFFELSVVIYINHPERPDVRDTTVELYYELARQRLHLDILNTSVFGKRVESLIFQAVASAFSRPILDTMLMSEIVPAERFFAVPPAERAILMRVAPLFNPAHPLHPHLADLETLLRADNVLFNLVGAAQIAIHAVVNPTDTEAVVRGLFERLPPSGRLWLLLSFSVLLPNTPVEWTPLVENLTERLFTEHPDLVYGVTPSILQQFDILLLPLGLAYGKVGQTMPLIELLLQDGLLRHDRRQVERVVAGLAAVGFYYPETVLRLLGDVVTALGADLPEALTPTLATIRMRHRDAVDVFMARRNLSEILQHRVAASADTELVRRYIYWLGLYNQVVHSCVYYPRMRRQMAMAAMEMLTRARTPNEFIVVYTATVFRMLREAGFRLSEWTREE